MRSWLLLGVGGNGASAPTRTASCFALHLDRIRAAAFAEILM